MSVTEAIRPPARRPSPLRRLLRSPLLHPFNDVGAIDDLLGRVHPTWSLRTVRARVLRVVEEAADVCSFELQANSRWRGARAGQHVLVTVEIDGVRVQRCYSLSAIGPQRGQLRISVKRQAQGRLSSRLHDHLRAGDVIELGPASGTFVLPATLPARILLIGAGSGMTPIRALLDELRERGYCGDLQLLQLCRTPDQALFAEELARLASTWPTLSARLHCSSGRGRFDAAELHATLPAFADYETWLCGPAALTRSLRAEWAAADAAQRLHVEDFGPGYIDATMAEEGARWAVQTGVETPGFSATAAGPLLVDAEAAGLTPRFGCRRGICHSCRCRKRSGAVLNLLTGEVDSTPDSWIQLCVSAARSDLEIELAPAAARAPKRRATVASASTGGTR